MFSTKRNKKAISISKCIMGQCQSIQQKNGVATEGKSSDYSSIFDPKVPASISIITTHDDRSSTATASCSEMDSSAFLISSSTTCPQTGSSSDDSSDDSSDGSSCIKKNTIDRPEQHWGPSHLDIMKERYQKQLLDTDEDDSSICSSEAAHGRGRDCRDGDWI